MIGIVIKKLVTSVLGRWVLGGLVAAGIGTAALMWHSHKEGLKEEGRLECVQEINQATIDALESALVDEKRAAAQLRASLVAAAAVNQEAVERRRQAETALTDLERQMQEQERTDETYREWANADLPDGVADRLREAARSPADSND